MLHPYLGVKCLTLVFNPKKERAREKEVQVTKLLGGQHIQGGLNPKPPTTTSI